MRNPEEIIFEINDISKLNLIEQKHTIRRAEYTEFNKHLKLCKPKHKRLFYKCVSISDWNEWLNERTEYYLLYYNNKPVARCAIEKYSDTAWEAADVKTATEYRNKVLSKEIVSFVTQKILAQGKTATCSTLPDNHAMLNVIHTLGFQIADIKNFFDISIELLNLDDYFRCSNIWNMKTQPLTEKWKEEIASGNRLVYIYKINGEFIGEGALVFDTGDADYTITNRRVYLSRLIVKKEYRSRGIGSQLLTFLIEKAEEMGFCEISIGVDKDNTSAFNLYKKFGFNEILFDGSDEHGEYFKLLKKLY